MADELKKRNRRRAASDSRPDEQSRLIPVDNPAGSAGSKVEPAPSGSASASASGSAPSKPASPAPSNTAAVSAAASVAPPKAPRQRRTREEINAAKTETQKAEAANIAGQLMLLADSLAVSALGPAAAMQDAERSLINIGLPAVLENMSVEAAQKFAALSNPLILAAGVGLWGLRLFSLADERAKANKAAQHAARAIVKPTEAPADDSKPSAPTGANGRGTGTGFGTNDERAELAEAVHNVY